MIATYNKSLSERLSKKISVSVLSLIMLIGICIFLGTYLFSRQTFNQQVKTWITIVPNMF